MKPTLLFLFTLVLNHVATAQAKMVTSEEVFKAVLNVKQAAEAADAVNEDAIRYCHATKAKITSKDLEKEVSRDLVGNGSRLPSSVAASDMWEVADVADAIEFGVGLDTMHCALRFNQDYRAQATAQSGLTAYSNLSTAKVEFEDLARRQTTWEEQQQRMIQEQ
jgi:hypothetical protein